MRTSTLAIVITAIVVLIMTPLIVLGVMYGSRGPAYVTGHFTGPNPVTGMPDYYDMLSDGTYVLVPWNVYNTAPYGSVLSFSSSRWSVRTTSLTRQGYFPDVNYSSWKSAKRVTTISNYSGMSSVSRGITVYKSGGGFSSRSSFRGR
jgi:hypothetical protein